MTRRKFIAASAACGLAAIHAPIASYGTTLPTSAPSRVRLQQFRHGDVKLTAGPLKTQFDDAFALYMKLDNDSILKVYRELTGQPAPGTELGGWYSNQGFGPGHAFGQWVSALSRFADATDDAAARDKVKQLVHGFAETLSGSKSFYEGHRFKAYCYDKHVLGLTEAYTLAGVSDAKDVLDRATDLAVKVLPEKALTRAEMAVRPHKDITYAWDESYTLPENLFLAHDTFGDSRYLELAKRYLHDKPYFEPLAAGKNAIVGMHAYSHMNALSSAARAYLALGDDMHLRAIHNAWDYIHAQSFATGGWGPNEAFIEPGKGLLGESLNSTHNHFETPCGSYAHFKLSRYLLRITGEPRFGDSLERMLYNGIGATLPEQADGSTFYYSDYHPQARKNYHPDKWPCCSGTYPQVIADYLMSIYFHDDSNNIFVNLYAPSELKHDGLTLTQSTDYPDGERATFRVNLSEPREFAINFRIPAWTASPRLFVNGQPQTAKAGEFAKVSRTWRDDDTVELTIPQTRRTQPVDDQHPNLVALVRGPVVLVATSPQLKIPREAIENDSNAAATEVQFVPFNKVKDQLYTTYFTQT